MGWKIEEPYSYTGKEASSRFDQLVFRALSEEIISVSKAASLNNMTVSDFKSRLMTVE
jgi:predicted HTH domain antitoxin